MSRDKKLLIGYLTLTLGSGSYSFFGIPLFDLCGYLGAKFSRKSKGSSDVTLVSQESSDMGFEIS